MKKFRLWGCLALLLVGVLAYRERTVDLRRGIAGQWFTSAGDVSELNFSPNLLTDGGNSGSVVMHHSRWESDEWLGYRLIGKDQIHITGPGANELWDVKADGCGTLSVSGSSRGIYYLRRGGGCFLAQASSERWDGLKKWWQLILVG